MKYHFSPIPMTLTVLAALTALTSCANPAGAPGGGPKDMMPPVLLVAQPPQGTVDFQDKVVTMEFDEFIELRNQDKIYASPVLNQVNYSSNLKKLKVEIDDTLRPDYTYTIRFGNSVVDLHEANPVPDFHYVFSTGTEIDSMYVNGRVIKAVDYKPEKNVRLLFYLHRPDSFPFQDEPDYVAIADDDGWFDAIHMREGCYYIYGVLDDNQDYRIDPVTEMMAYTDTCIPTRKMIPEVVLSAADSLALIDSLMLVADSLMEVADSLAWLAAYAAYDADTVEADTAEAAYAAYAEAVVDADTAGAMAADTLSDAVAETETEADAFVHLYLYRDYLPAFFLKEVTYKQRNQMAFTFYYPIDSIEDIRFIEVTDTSETELTMPLYWRWAVDRRSAVVHFPNHTMKDCDLMMTVNGYTDTTSVYMADAVRSRTDTAALQLKATAAKLLVADTLKVQASFPIERIDQERMAVWRFVQVERAVRDTVWLQRDTLLSVVADTVPMPVADTLSSQLADTLSLPEDERLAAVFDLVDTVRMFTDTLVQPFELWPVDAWTWAVQTELEEGGRYAFFMSDSAVFDFFGRPNDTTVFGWQAVAPEEGGDLALDVQGLQAGAVYVLQLMQGDQIKREVRLTDTGMVEFLALKPAQYTFRLFKDDNDNGHWDEGDYVARRQPEEHWYYHKTLRVEADWRIEDIWRIE